MKSVNIYIPLLLLLFSVGACGTKKSGGTSGALTDEALLDTVQRRTFNYFWDGAEPNSGWHANASTWMEYIPKTTGM